MAFVKSELDRLEFERLAFVKSHPVRFVSLKSQSDKSASVKFEPSLFIVRYGSGTIITDINTKWYYRNRYWLLLSYQGRGEVLAGLAFMFKPGLQLCYSYAINTNGLAGYNAGSQNISLRMNIAAIEINIKKKK